MEEGGNSLYRERLPVEALLSRNPASTITSLPRLQDSAGCPPPSGSSTLSISHYQPVGVYMAELEVLRPHLPTTSTPSSPQRFPTSNRHLRGIGSPQHFPYLADECVGGRWTAAGRKRWGLITGADLPYHQFRGRSRSPRVLHGSTWRRKKQPERRGTFLLGLPLHTISCCLVLIAHTPSGAEIQACSCCAAGASANEVLC